jgi:hypothetical protein
MSQLTKLYFDRPSDGKRIEAIGRSLPRMEAGTVEWRLIDTRYETPDALDELFGNFEYLAKNQIAVAVSAIDFAGLEEQTDFELQLNYADRGEMPFRVVEVQRRGRKLILRKGRG